MKKHDRVKGFETLVRDHQGSSHYFEEENGEHRHWAELSPSAKLGYIARDAHLYDVPFEPFYSVVQEALGDVPIPMLIEASLWMAFSHSREQHRLEQLFPNDYGAENPDPFVDRFREILNSSTNRPSEERCPDHMHGREI